jgi:hypothetical protein
MGDATSLAAAAARHLRKAAVYRHFETSRLLCQDMLSLFGSSDNESFNSRSMVIQRLGSNLPLLAMRASFCNN